MSLRTKPRAALVRARTLGRRLGGVAGTELDRLRFRGEAADVAVFHEYAPPPSGGGNQFVAALVRELEGRGVEVEWNRISGGTPACLFNSFNFDFRRLRRFARDGVRMVHRVDGPIGVYRGFDDGTDRRILSLNDALAQATVFQSRWSLEAHRELGFELRDPHVIPNAPDPAIFFPPEGREPRGGRRLRVIASSWSDNPRKGADAVVWLDEHLDHDRYELTFVGRTQVRLEHARVVGPLASRELAELLRTQDAYLAASADDPCSNALLEALACGLPALFRRSGGHPELVGDAGVAFDEPEELGDALDRLAAELDECRSRISVPALADVADRYLRLLRG
jgi:glycosyltransferase involved in cell wall biosynthesis